MEAGVFGRYLWLPLATISGKIPIVESAIFWRQNNIAQLELVEE